MGGGGAAHDLVDDTHADPLIIKKMTCIGPWMHPAIPRLCIAEADPRYHAVHATNHRHKRYQADHRHERHQAHPGLIRPASVSCANGPGVFMDRSGENRHPERMTTHDDSKHPETELMTCLARLNLRDDGAKALLLRFAHAATCITDVPTLDRIVGLVEIIAKKQGIVPSPDHLHRVSLLMVAAQMPAECLQEALTGITGIAGDDEPTAAATA